MHAGINTSAVLVMGAGLLWHRPRHPLVWYLLILATALFAVSNLYWAAQAAGVYGGLLAGADMGTRLVAVLALCGVAAVLLRTERLRPPPLSVADGALVVTGTVLLFGQLAVLAQERVPRPSFGTIVAPLALLVLSLAMFSVAARLVTGPGRATVSSALLVLSAALLPLGQAVILLPPAGAARWVDATWLTASILNGAAALYPSMASEETARAGTRAGPPAEPGPPRRPHRRAAGDALRALAVGARQRMAGATVDAAHPDAGGPDRAGGGRGRGGTRRRGGGATGGPLTVGAAGAGGRARRRPAGSPVPGCPPRAPRARACRRSRSYRSAWPLPR